MVDYSRLLQGTRKNPLTVWGILSKMAWNGTLFTKTSNEIVQCRQFPVWSLKTKKLKRKKKSI